jgi:transcriptional regulator with XRE-family HTH domain
MPGQPTPTLRRRELGFRLRELRQRAGLTAEQVAGELMCSVAKISRLETGARGVNPRDVRDLATLYGVDPAERARLMSLVRESKQHAWWQEYDLPSWVLDYVGLEAAASAISAWQPVVVPGLLQTEDYARAVLREYLFEEGEDGVDRLVHARTLRQRLLGTGGLRYRVLMDEAALHRVVGGRVKMRAQLEEIVRRVRGQRLDLGVVPFSAGAHVGMVSAFNILEFEEGQLPDVVYVEGLAGSLVLERSDEVARYHRAFDSIRAKAYNTHDSLELIRQTARSLTYSNDGGKDDGHA